MSIDSLEVKKPTLSQSKRNFKKNAFILHKILKDSDDFYYSSYMRDFFECEMKKDLTVKK